MRLKSHQLTDIEPVAPPAVDLDRALGRLAAALRLRTIADADGRVTDAAPFDAFRALIERSFPRVHAGLARETFGGHSLLFTWQGRRSDLAPVVLMSHYDVVPVEPGTESDWTHPAFAGVTRDGSLWGRGAVDDKTGVLGILEAVELHLAEGFAPDRTFYLAFGHDEETGGLDGARAIAAALRERGVRPALVLDEGGAVVHDVIAGIDAPVALVGVAEKGYVNLRLTVEGQGGHSSTPPPQTAVGILAAALARLERRPVAARIEGATRHQLDYLAPHMPPVRRTLLGNLWAFGSIVERDLLDDPKLAATLRTTTAITLVSGGVKDNVLPQRASAVVNFRILPGETIASVEKHVRDVVADDRVGIEALAFRSEPAPVTPVSGPAFRLVQQTIQETLPDVVVAPYLTLAATDSRYFARDSDAVLRFLPVRLWPTDLDAYHGTNERLRSDNYAEVVAFFHRLIANAATEFD